MKPSVTVLSIGPGNEELLNLKTVKVLRNADTLILRTEKHPIVHWLDRQGIRFSSMDSLYESAENFDQLFSDIAVKLWKSATDQGPVVYAVSDVLSDRSVDALFRNRPESSILEIVPGFSYADFYLASCRGLFSTADIRICSAYDFQDREFDPSVPFLITELNDEISAAEVKNHLSAFLDDEDTVFFLDSKAKPYAIPLFELDRQSDYNHLTAVAGGGRSYLQRNAKTLGDLTKIMDLLRSQEGCPWDRKQTHSSLKPYLVEEAWEVVDSINEKDPLHLMEELGDLLFQIVFHASIGKSFDEFTINDIITEITNKMIRRHPHVFRKDYVEKESCSSAEWEQIKREEKGNKTLGESLDGISNSLPSLRYAEKTINKLQGASLAGLSADDMLASAAGILNKARNCGKPLSEKEMGNLLFFCAGLADCSGMDGEVILHQTVRRVIDSFKAIENRRKGCSDISDPLTFNDLGVY